MAINTPKNDLKLIKCIPQLNNNHLNNKEHLGYFWSIKNKKNSGIYNYIYNFCNINNNTQKNEECKI